MFEDDNLKPASQSPHSSRVRLWLESDVACVELSQVGADFVIARSGGWEIPRGEPVWVVASVDGRESRIRYALVDGLSPQGEPSKVVPLLADGLPF